MRYKKNRACLQNEPIIGSLSHLIKSSIQKNIAAIYGQGTKKSTFNRLRVAFNNAYRQIFDLPWRCSASGMYATYGIYNLEAIIRKQTFGFIGRLRKSCNTIVQTHENAWIIRIQLWHTWFELLYTNI